MTTLYGRTGTALLVIDMQQGVVADSHDLAGVTANIAALVAAARADGTPVIWVQHSDDYLPEGSDEWQLIPELVRLEAEPLVRKHYGDSFEATDLEPRLAERGVGHLVVTGAATDACVRATLHGAFTRGYDVTLVGDAHTTIDRSEPGLPSAAEVIALTNLYWQYTSAPGRTAGTVSAKEVTFAGAGA
jgi:nicotinamidase-related amidase